MKSISILTSFLILISLASCDEGDASMNQGLITDPIIGAWSRNITESIDGIEVSSTVTLAFLEQNNAGTSSIDFTSEIVEEDTTNAGPSEQDTFTWENTSSALDWTSTTQNYTLSFDGLDGYELVYAVFSGNFNDLELTTVSSDPDEEDDVQNLVRN